MKEKADRAKDKDAGQDRRRFILKGCAACAGAASLTAAGGVTSCSHGKLRIRVVYALDSEVQDKPGWPHQGFDFRPVMQRYNNALADAFPHIEFRTAKASGPLHARAIILTDVVAGIDGYIVIQMSSWNRVIHGIAASGKPVLFTSMKYGGSAGLLIDNAGLMREKVENVGFVASSDMDDLSAAVRCFESVAKSGRPEDFSAAVARTRTDRTPPPSGLSCVPDPVETVFPETAIERLRRSTIVAVGKPAVNFFTIPFIRVKMIPFSELDSATGKADRDLGRDIAMRWQSKADKVVHVSERELQDSAAIYLGMKSLLKEHGAEAITINCLTGFYHGLLRSYPCMGFFQLNNEGLVGACECDIRSAGTMLAIKALTGGRPGYISDPVLDSSRREIVYAHCVGANRPFGPEGPANPYHIMTHSEDRKGASIRSILPEGYMTTTIEIAPEKKQILFHQARTTGNDSADPGCRTKLTAEPAGDFEKLFTMWDKWHWHRVTAYGDLKEPVFGLADALGYEAVEES